MIIRRRIGGAICLIPYILFLIIGIIFENKIIIDFSFILLILGVLFSGKIYDKFLLNSNSTSSLYAGKIALQYGYEPKGQNGIIWNPTEYKISEIYNLYPRNRTNLPVEGTAGFIFYTNKKRKSAKQMEFYDYRLGGNCFIDYEFYFHPYDNNGDSTIRKEVNIQEITKEMIFVPL